MASSRYGQGKGQKRGSEHEDSGFSKRPRLLSPKKSKTVTEKQTTEATHSRSLVEVDSAALEVSIAKFAESRAKELEALAQAVEQIGGTKLSFQRIPRHMRRRAMSHNIRRIPRRLREKAQAELQQREKKGTKKRPSRRYRRRPSNLLSEYQRRQRRNMWLETHIWHAKRFKMTTAWGYRLPVHPSDKSLRACYRATAHYCLLQDISYECCIQVKGPGKAILEALSHLTSKDAGLTFAAKLTSTGQRWGKVMMYAYDAYPRGAVAPVAYLWRAGIRQHNGEKNEQKEGDVEEEERMLWMWCHPACYIDMWNHLTHACALPCTSSSNDTSTPDSESLDKKETTQPSEQKTKNNLPQGGIDVHIGQLHLHSLKDQLIKFHLTGPASNLILSETLKLADVGFVKEYTGTVSGNSLQEKKTIHDDSLQENNARSGRSQESKTMHGDRLQESKAIPWWQKYYASEEKLEEFAVQTSSWKRITKCQSPDELPPRAVVALTVRDPRVLLPSVRTKAALHKADSAVEVMTWEHLPADTAVSPLLDNVVREDVTKTKMTEQEMNKRRSQLLIPGSALELGGEESQIPVLLLQRPGSHSTSSKENAATRSGVGSGWDLIAPKGWGMVFWVAMVYRGARVGGLREGRSLTTRSAQLYFPHDFPDCTAGQRQQEESRNLAIEKHVRRPPAKRVNYKRCGVPAPFHCPWTQLVAEWQDRGHEIMSSVGGVSTKVKTPSAKSLPSSKAEENSKQAVTNRCGTVGDKDAETSCSPYPDVYVLRCRHLLRALQEALKMANPKRIPKGKGQNDTRTRLSAFFCRPLDKTLVHEHLGSLVPIAVSCYLRGVPVERAMICLPTATDLEQWTKNSKISGPIESLHPCHKTQVDKTVRKKKKKSDVKPLPTSQTENTKKKRKQKVASKTEDVENKVTPKESLNAKQLEEKRELMKEPSKIVGAADRLAIGFLTNGDFDMGQGRGAGIGFCSLAGLLAAFKDSRLDKPLLVLVRNPMSRQYRFADLSILT